ncbi:MaoC family dehydratase [Aequoribacter sp.]|uniref:MaoC family dehydratase n=1 Tax=Aequoribacter sp. TaxID=2847771 RepID=UPI003F698D2E
MPVQIVAKDELIHAVGTQLPSTPWIELTQDRINMFAECSGDKYFIHVDEEKAKQTPLGGTIAHGLLTLSLLPYLMENFVVPENMVHGLNYGFDKVRFLAPVRSGKRVRLHSEVIDVERKDEKRFIFKISVTVEIEGEDTPALIAEWMNMYITE